MKDWGSSPKSHSIVSGAILECVKTCQNLFTLKYILRLWSFSRLILQKFWTHFWLARPDAFTVPNDWWCLWCTAEVQCQGSILHHYCDTDSIIYSQNCLDLSENPDCQTWSYLGEMTNELPDDGDGDSFYSARPKCYSMSVTTFSNFGALAHIARFDPFAITCLICDCIWPLSLAWMFRVTTLKSPTNLVRPVRVNIQPESERKKYSDDFAKFAIFRANCKNYGWGLSSMLYWDSSKLKLLSFVVTSWLVESWLFSSCIPTLKNSRQDSLLLIKFVFRILQWTKS